MTTDALPTTMQAVRITAYGGADVLELQDVPVPQPDQGEVLVRVLATAINPGEMAIREGAMAESFPMDFPFGEGSDLAGEVVSGEGFAPGDRVFGWTDQRAAHAEYAVVPATQLARIPDGVALEQAGSLYVIGATAVAAVAAVDPQPGETVVISGAAGGVGVLATQLAVATGARVIALASEANHDWLRGRGAEPMPYDGDLEGRLRDERPAAFLDLFGGGYVELALELGVPKERIDTIIDFAAVQEHGVQAKGNADGADIANLTRLADQLAAGTLELPIARTYPLADVRAAYAELAARHTRGKIVLKP